MKILGLGHDVWLSSAALLDAGRVVAAVCEERLNRQKLYIGFPAKAVAYCLQAGGVTLDGIDAVAVGWNPARHLVRPNRRRAVTSWKADYLVTVPNQLQQFAGSREISGVEQRFFTGAGPLDLVYVDHHLAHLASAFYLSPFAEAALLTIDGVGEVDTGTMAVGDGQGIRILKRVKYPHSLGLFYSTFTSHLGFTIHSDEWKVMALAAFGRDRAANPYYAPLRDTIALEPEGFFELDLTYFNFYLQDEVGFSNDKLVAAFGPPRGRGEDFDQRHYDLAAAVQLVFEDVAAHCLRSLHALTGGLDAVGVAGGSFMNSVFNGKLEQVGAFARAFIPSCPDDSGVSVGAALAVQAMRDGNALPRDGCEENYWGPEYSDDEIEATLRRYGVAYQRVRHVERETARLLAAGHLVGWFQGRMEFGQRALGSRSILADPRDPETKHKVNAAVKYREAFRPFAPAVLEEHTETYFEAPAGVAVPFMERVYPVRPEYRGALGAVTHVDGSGRLQTVSKRTNPRFYALIEEFGRLVGIPVVLNTSFNLNGEPIVCSPTDALRTFFSCGLDYLVLGDFLVGKDQMVEIR